MSATASAASRTLRRGDGAAIGGLVLLKIDPEAIRQLAVGRRTMLVSGTNGKTTTTGMLVVAVASGARTPSPVPVCTNAQGANMRTGVVHALSHSDALRTVLEVDEAYLPSVIEETVPDVVVLTNLSRDQLDRLSEVAFTARRWREALADSAGDAVVVANVDDPHIVWAAQAARRTVWVATGRRWELDSALCPECGSLLLRQGDDWSCTCGLRRPRPDWNVEGSVISAPDGRRLEVALSLPGSVNISNAVMAVAAAAQWAVDPAVAVEAAGTIQAIQGRYEVRREGGRDLQLVLVKNPASWQSFIELVEPEDDVLLVAANGRAADGRDLSWLWDIDFERLAGRRVAVIGDRRLDVAVRFEAAGMVVDVRPDLASAVATLPAGRVRVAASYTALQDLRRATAAFPASPTVGDPG